MISRESFAPLRHPGFRYFVGARFASMFGNAVAPIALAFAVIDLSGSKQAAASSLGIVLAARSIPMILFMLVGGVVADRLPRQRIMVTANAVCFGTQGIAATLLLSGHAQIWQLAIVEAVNGASFAFLFPASTGLVPLLVPRPEWQQANALNGLARNVTTIGGASAGGIVVGFLSPGWGLTIDAVTFGVAALLLARIRLPRVEASGERSHPLHDLRVGWREFVAHRWLWLIVVAFGGLIAAQVCAWSTLGPVVADGSFGRTGWGFVSTANSVGTVLGLTVMLRFRPRFPLRLGMIGIVIEAPALFVLGLAPGLAQLLVLAFVGGLGSSAFGVAWETALQQHIPNDRLSRVSSYDALGSFVAMPIGQLAAGPLASVFGLREAIVGSALVYTAFAAGTLLDPSVRNLRRVDQNVETPAVQGS